MPQERDFLPTARAVATFLKSVVVVAVVALYAWIGETVLLFSAIAFVIGGFLGWNHGKRQSVTLDRRDPGHAWSTMTDAELDAEMVERITFYREEADALEKLRRDRGAEEPT